MDESLVAKAKGGDRGAMEELLGSVAPSIKRFALRMCRNEADAEDALQDALVSIATNLDTFEGRSSVPTWAFALTRSACARRRRGKKNAPAESDSALAEKAADAPGPDELAASGELGALVSNALESLSDDHREVLLLRDAEGLTAPEAAAALGVSVDALKSRLHRARAALRDALRPVLERDGAAPKPSCPDVIAALSRKLEDELDPNACAEMEKHVAECSSCARACDALKDALRACRMSSTPQITPDVADRVRRAVQSWITLRSQG